MDTSVLGLVDRTVFRVSVFRVSYIFKDLITHIGQEKSRQSSWLRSTSNPEGPTAFDDLE